ncbi:MAG: site-2 protease family protein [Thermoplasmata archaeon]|nr:site-2 protease family protein [Thermoplasmata archaeon]
MMGTEAFQQSQEEIEKVKSIVGKHFSIYEVKVSPDVISLYCRLWTPDVSDKFEALRMDMKDIGYIPVIRHEGGEYIIHAQKKPKARYRSTRVNLILLIATIATTAFAGMWNWAGYEGYYDRIPWTLEILGNGILFFAFPLLLILGVHELGHYYMAKKHKVDASLPFFIPLPISPLGTLGAVISMREPIPNRKALIEIGAAGPICGLIVAIPVAVIGWYLTGAVARPLPVNVGDMGTFSLQFPLIYYAIDFFMPLQEGIVLHPMAFAGWVGIFVTALNLLPAGQLDGGHIARAVLGDNAKYVSYGAIFFLLFLGMFSINWLIIGLIIIFLGVRHAPPLNDITKLDNKRKLLGLGLAFVMLVSFAPIPFDISTPNYNFEFNTVNSPGIEVDEINITADVDTTFNYTFRIINTGNTFANLSVAVDEINLQNLRNENWNLSFVQFDGTVFNYLDTISVKLNSTESRNVTMRIKVPNYTETDKTYAVEVKASMKNFRDSDIGVKTLFLNIRTQ